MKRKNKTAETNEQVIKQDPTYLKIPKYGVYLGLILLAASTFASGYFAAGANKVSEGVVDKTVEEVEDGSATGTVDMGTIKGLWSKNLIKFGKGDKKLLMVEVSDPSCPFCNAAAGVNKKIADLMGDRFKPTNQGGSYLPPVPEMKKLVDEGKADYVYLYMNGHGNGELATMALYYAHEVGKFWEVHDRLMSAEGYEFINETIGADTSKSQEMADFLKNQVDAKGLKEALDSGKYEQRLADEQKLAAELGVDGTPGFYLNTTNFSGAYSWDQMKTTAEEALK